MQATVRAKRREVWTCSAAAIHPPPLLKRPEPGKIIIWRFLVAEIEVLLLAHPNVAQVSAQERPMNGFVAQRAVDSSRIRRDLSEYPEFHRKCPATRSSVCKKENGRGRTSASGCDCRSRGTPVLPIHFPEMNLQILRSAREVRAGVSKAGVGLVRLCLFVEGTFPGSWMLSAAARIATSWTALSFRASMSIRERRGSRGSRAMVRPTAVSVRWSSMAPSSFSTAKPSLTAAGEGGSRKGKSWMFPSRR